MKNGLDPRKTRRYRESNGTADSRAERERSGWI